MNYAAPWWLPGGNLQTIWAALRSRRSLGPAPQFRRERWTTPDDDFVDVDWLVPGGTSREAFSKSGVATSVGVPLLVIFHGLEGSSASHYAEAFADVASLRGWACAVPHFRGCSGEVNLAPRAYHSGDFAEIDWILRRFARQHAGPVVAVGISLGGNALMRWAAELGTEAGQVVAGIASVCSPLDLTASGWAIGRGFNRQVYTRMFLKTMVPKALQKLEQHPGLFDRQRLLAARDLYEFDNAFTAPVHGFKDADDYWASASAKPHLHKVVVPALALNALNDPFVPADSLPQAADVSRHVTLWQPAQGGHVGFPSAPFPGHVRAMPEAVIAFLAAQL
ncbi:YheT family hydrolase [Polaromonas jejuensis]|uniref:YheT family hydrolase n=1 Tax=Polaromonas jejuensis TaxID=457502 RepID=A0ABW0QBJ2_9BURK|nr:alpha/beta fold hydrolase [Polaromonas jejuensis]